MDPNLIGNKILEVFQIFLDPDFNVSGKCDTLEKFFALLTNREYEIEHNFSFYAEWLSEMVDIWKIEYKILKTELVVFVTKLAAFVARNHKSFLRKRRVLIRILETARSASNELSVKHAYLDLIGAISEDAVVLKWSVTQSYWVHVLDMVDEKNENFNDKLCQTVTSLLETAAKFDDKICKKNLKAILDSVFDVNDITSMEKHDKYLSNINFVVAITERLFENFIEDVLGIFLDLQVIAACENILKLKEPPFFLQLNRMIVMLCLFKMTKAFEGIKAISEDPLSLSGIFKIVERYMWSENIPELLEFAYYATLYWKKISEKLPTHFMKGQPFMPDRELVRLQLMPIATTAIKFMNQQELNHMTETDIVRMSYYLKIYGPSSVKFSLLGPPLRKLYKKMPVFATYEALAIEIVIKSIAMYTQEDAIQVLHVLIYALDDYVNYFKQKEINLHHTSVAERYFLSTLFQGIFEMLRSFELSWKECLPIINIVALTLRILTNDNWISPKITKWGLNVLAMAISKKMEPNMILLRDTATDLYNVDIQSFLQFKCLDNDLEIRRAVLAVLNAISRKAIADFPALEEILRHKPLVDLIVKIASEDPVLTVREEATRCIQNLLQVPNAAEYFRITDLIDTMLPIIMVEESNPEIRIEALQLITIIYGGCENPDPDIWKIYENMVCAGFRDTDSETKIHMVNFWGKVLDKQLTNQGLEHGEFPSAIFSKEKRKIITIDQAEVSRRLLTALDEANCTGCFAVLFNILNSKCCSEAVVNKVLTLLNDLRQLLNKYKISPDAVDGYQYLDSPILFSSQHHPGTPTWCLSTFEDGIELDSILDDVELKSLHSPARSQLSCHESRSISETKFPTSAEVLKFVFEELPNRTYKSYLTNEFEELLDAILTAVCDK
ncbi:uncharacterized protein LOC132704808 isoform X1 [Cylas formicarius]|uniref:uncharacterized protein LOC132704808 isoform X1 n=1 Tax=Cylas formicarius TaxID=197179 RepID=UPI0029587F62|nr:uncharacterized protein LOC132704808 isoform X1 [Cylas formicarius]